MIGMQQQQQLGRKRRYQQQQRIIVQRCMGPLLYVMFALLSSPSWKKKQGIVINTARAFTATSSRPVLAITRSNNMWPSSANTYYYHPPGFHQDHRRFPSKRTLFLSAVDNADIDDTTNTMDTHRTWNISGLKKEIARLTLRCHKKIGKANQRFQKANSELERLTSDPDVTLEELERCPNVEQIETELESLRERLVGLNRLDVLLEDEFKGKKKTKNKDGVILPDHIVAIVEQLDIADAPPQRPQRGPKKEKGPTKMVAFRLPYRRFYTRNNTEIRVGKQAEDNDELTMNPQHRDSLDWWMHASGCPGSHIVIRCHDQFDSLDDEVVQDAAALAARQSKCTGNTIKVSMTRPRDIKKPPGAKAGLVQLTGQIRTITVNMKKAEERLVRLDTTVLIN